MGLGIKLVNTKINKKNTGLFSVLLSVFKDDNSLFLHDALKSVSSEQSLSPAEIVIVADGALSQECSKAINSFIDEFDEVVKFIQLENNVGLAEALNTGLAHCTYELVARMDADDISLPSRFEEQYNFFQNNPKVSVCGTFINEVHPITLNVISCRQVPTSHTEILNFARKRSPMSHPSVMFRKDDVVKHGGYPRFRKSQDYALWSLLLTKGAIFANIPKVLVNMRAGDDMHKRRGIQHLRYEIAVINFQFKIGFISYYQYFFNALGRCILRLSPTFISKVIYKMMR